MKNVKSLLVAFLTCFVQACSDKNAVEVPIEFVDGYGPFELRWSVMRTYAVDDQEKIDLFYSSEVKHLPKELDNVRIGSVNIGLAEEGVLDVETFVSIFDYNVIVVYGRDKRGRMKMVIDANRNKKLDDDAILELPFFANFDEINGDSLSNYPVMIRHQQRFNSKIIEKQAPLLVAYVDEIGDLVGCFPQYALGVLEGQQIAVSSPFGLSYNSAKIYPIASTEEKVDKHDLIGENEYFTIGEATYQNKGVDLNKNALLLKKIDSSERQLYSGQSGYKAHPFTGEDYRTNEPISLDSYKGKYLLIDFWAIWCGPCIADMPELKALYDRVDRNKIDFLGIVGASKEKGLKELLERNEHIVWPQLYDKKNRIIETYNISSYPTTLLIDPQGMVVAKNLRSAALESKIRELNLLQ